MKKTEYNHTKIEKKWQNTWKLKKIYKTQKETGKKCYVLDMFPYPSGAGLHVGHPRGYIASDVFARMRRMQGYNVLHPMGFDSFGLPAEQYAIKTGKHPGPFTDQLVSKYIKQLEIIGFSYDWSRMVETHDPKYYKWTQWIFLKIYNSYFDIKANKAKPINELIKLFEKNGNSKVHAFCDKDVAIFSAKDWNIFSEIEKQNILMKYRLAYEGQAEVNWCAELGTVLANDEVIDGPNGELLSERGDYPVEKRMMRQWMMRITAYAERLLSGLENLDWALGLKETQKNWIGKEILQNGEVKYKMRDAIFARQRYWGEPIPLMHKKDGTIVEVAESKLPLKLPNVKSYKPSGTGESPLSQVREWTTKGYETNTMPGWAGSSWYFLRYMDPTNSKKFASEKAVKYWGQVDMYVGGVEHASGHLLYSRFWNKVLKDLGYVKQEEPFATLKNQGFIIAEDGRKMSKRWGNVINPDEIVKTYGADTLRVYEMFMGPFDQLIAWNTDSMMGSRRFIEKVWRINNEFVSIQTHKDVSVLLHKTIKKVTEDIEGFSFNTAISSMMIFLNEIGKDKPISKNDYKMFLQILAPFAPHVTEELWSILGEKKSIHLSPWPKYNKSKVKETEFEIPVQVNGKVRAVLRIPAGLNENQIKKLALADGNIQKFVDKEIKKVIYIPNKIINIVL